MTATFEAYCPTIECDGCANSIRRTLGKAVGVESVTVEVAAKNVRVQYDPAQTNPATLCEHLARNGFEPDLERVA